MCWQAIASILVLYILYSTSTTALIMCAWAHTNIVTYIVHVICCNINGTWREWRLSILHKRETRSLNDKTTVTSDESVKLQKAFLDLHTILVEKKPSLPLLYMESSLSERQNGQLVSPQLLNRAFSMKFTIYLLNRHEKPNGTLLV